MNLSDEQLRRLIHDTVSETLTSLGIDQENPMDMQKDFQYLREFREASDSVKQKGILVLVGILVSGFLGALWLGIKDSFSAFH